MGDVETGLEPGAEGDGPGGGVERGAEQHTPELGVRYVEPAQVDPVKVRVPEGGGQTGVKRRAELRGLGGDGAATVRGDGEPAQAARFGEKAALSHLGAFRSGGGPPR